MASRRSKRVRRMQLAEEPVEQDNEINADEDYVQPDESLPDDSKSVTSEAGTSSETLPETSSGTPAKMYYDYDPNVFQSVVRYRTHSDIVASTIIQSQANGVDRYEIGKHLSLNCKTKAGNRRVSAYITELSKRYPDQISQFQKMEGKIRILKYFYKSGESTPTSFLELLEKLENILGQKFPYNCSDVVKFPGKKLSALRISDVTLRRFYFILEFLKEEGVIVLIWRLSRYIAKKEADLGYQFAIDKKSVMKCLHALEQKQIVRLFKVGEPEPEAKPETGVDDESMGGDGESSTQIPIVVPYSIDDPNDQRIKDAIIRVHEELSNEGRIFPTGQYSSTKQAAPTTTQPRQTRKRKKKIENDNVEQNLFTVEERYKYTRYSFDSVRKKSDSEESVVSSVNGDNTDFDYGHQSKMIRCAVLHEFIYRVVHYMNRDSNTLSLYDRFPLNKYLPANTEPTPIESLPDLDDEPDSPYRHVVRIPPFKDAQRGWFMIRDVLQGMPLSIYVLLVKQQHAIDDLKEFLEDPERRHIPLADLPISMRKQLFTRQSALAIEHLCQLMSVMGLMRCSPPHGNKANVMGPHALFFCGKKAFFYDTSTSGRGYALVIPPIKQYKRYDYNFKTIENVLEYWNHLKAVCWSTSLGARHIPEGQENFKSDTRKYAQGNVDRAPFTADYDTEIDLISPVGTFDGCAGFDAQLFSHLQRNWEVHSPQNAAFTSWFLARWQQTSVRLSSYVSERVARLESNWNSFIASFLPSDNELIRKKKNEQAPILNQKTMDSLSSTFRRHNVARKITSQPPTNKRKPASKKSLQAFDSITSILDSIQREGNLIKDGQMPSTSSSPPQSAKKGTKNSANKKGGVQIKEEPMDEESMDTSETASPASSKRSGAKRKLDETDLKSIQASTNMRSRFTNNEYDMLVLIRSISYFLNPIHRFWLNPSVMRDIMHMYVPESRSKTVSSLLAASAREMLRPGRTNQLQYIVKTFTDDKKMIKIRDELAVQCKNDEEKSGVFWQAFTTAHKLIFLENEGTPDASVNDGEFQKYLTKKKISICPAEVSPIAGFPRRSRKPQNLEDVQHFVAYNVVMSTLITEACRVSGIEDGNSENPTSFRSDFLINSISPASLTETLEICRSDGLISRVRNTEAKAYLTKNQVTISIYFRHFFNHIYRKDLVDLLKEILLDPPQEGYNPTDDDNPAALIHMLDFVQHNQQYQINLAHLTELIDINVKPTFDENGKEVKSATKNMRQLETAPMRLDRITINFPQKIQNAIVVPQREDVAQIICPVYSNTTFEDSISMQNELRAQLKKHPSLSKKVSVDDALRVLGFITLSEFNGTTFSDLKENTNMNDTNLSQVLELFAKLSIAFPCGIDVKRYVSAENSQAWLIKTDTSRFAPRPWTLPNGLVNWPILRWMSEAMLTTILLKSGIKIEELNNLFACVLSPILVRELIDFLATIGCCLLKEEHFASQKVLSPFKSDQRGTETYLYVTPVLDALKKFAVFFADTPMPESLLHREKV